MATYKLKSGPGRDDLLLGLTDQKVLWFRVFDDAGKTHLFHIAVLTLGMPVQERNHFAWQVKGLIIEKDGQEIDGERATCQIHFDTQRREGKFEEIEAVKKYSFEYFDGLLDHELRKEIEGFKTRTPLALRELKEYALTLSTHQRLVLEAMHTQKLHKACFGTRLDHELGSEFKQMMQQTQ